MKNRVFASSVLNVILWLALAGLVVFLIVGCSHHKSSNPFSPTPGTGGAPTSKVFFDFKARTGTSYALEVASEDLKDALQLERALDVKVESWSGGMLCAIDWTGGPFTQNCAGLTQQAGAKDKFAFPKLFSGNGKIDLSFQYQPGMPPNSPIVIIRVRLFAENSETSMSGCVIDDNRLKCPSLPR
ncbi:MAG: hypothetical protein ACM3KM_03160 [Acidobacteriaceae bacterium]